MRIEKELSSDLEQSEKPKFGGKDRKGVKGGEFDGEGGRWRSDSGWNGMECVRRSGCEEG